MPLSIVAYHYVRDLRRSRYPAIKGRTMEAFRAQLDHLERSYTLVGVADVAAALAGEAELPGDAALLTFDDGYLDHYTNVFPLLFERGIQGAFFPPARAVLERRVLAVNKIHFTLAACPDAARLVDALRHELAARAGNPDVQPFEAYWNTYGTADRFDSAETVFIKRMLQVALPAQVRHQLVDTLFRTFVSVDEAAFAGELYVTEDQLRTMQACGMYVGSHGWAHVWLDSVPAPELREEVERSLAFLDRVGAPTKDWVMCYPYGAHDERVRRTVAELGCAFALTTHPAQPARIGIDDRWALPRLDTNDLPPSV